MVFISNDGVSASIFGKINFQAKWEELEYIGEFDV